ncbi:MAG: CoA transferase, partial [Dehalococcoidia bacterium]
IVEFDHPVLGQVKIPGFPVSFSRSASEVRSAAPHFGQHTEEVLLQVGGYTWDEITELKEQEVT